ncbi:MAG: hypothetical protein AB7R40_23810 [Nitrospiraceae bacterium]
MNLRLAIKRHEDMANAFARIGKAKLARLHLLRAEELRKTQQIKRELRQ